MIAAGDLAAVRLAAGAHGDDTPPEVIEVSLGGAVVTPGIVEGHAHMLMFGESLSKVQLRDAGSLAMVQERLAAARAAAPDAPHILRHQLDVRHFC